MINFAHCTREQGLLYYRQIRIYRHGGRNNERKEYMKTIRSFLTMVFCVGAMFLACEAIAGNIVTQKAVEPGVWTSDYNGAMSYAEANNIPMFVLWANKGCSHCDAVEKAMNTTLFLDWMDQHKMVMVFVESDSKVKSDIMKWAKAKKNSISAYPFAAVYWPKNSKGEMVLEGFSAYTGNMSQYGVSSRASNVQQIMDSVDFLLADWNPNGVDPVDPQPDPDPVYYTVNFVVDAEKGTATGALSQQVESGKSAVAPSVKAKDGWEFVGWDKTFNKVTTDLTVTAKFSAVEPDPDPVFYTVNFVVDAEKGTVTGELSQSVQAGKGAAEPVVTANEGWEFVGWDKPFSKVKSNLTVTALFEQPADRDEIDPAVFFKKAMTLEAIAYEKGELFGRAAVTLGKYNAKKKYLKATFKITSFGGKTYSKSLNLLPNEYGDFLGIEVAFKSPIGAMVFDLYNGEDGYEVVGEGDDYSVESGVDIVLGGLLENEEMTFAAEFDELEPENDNFDFLYDMPSATATVKAGKTLNFGAAPKITYKKFREDGETWYELTEFDEDRYPNVNAVKLSYKPTTGVFSGSFKIYASNESAVDYGKKPTIKTYTAKFSGYVVNGVGVGTVSVKVGKKTYKGTCSLN